MTAPVCSKIIGSLLHIEAEREPEMPFSERVEELDREIRGALGRAVAQLRAELTERLRRGQEELLLALEEVEPPPADELVDLSDLAPLAEEQGTTARRGAFSELRDALSALDRARSQAEVLSALLAASARYCSRALLLLLRGREVRGWSGRAFGDEEVVRALSLPLAADGPWGTMAGGHGTVPLTAGDCAALCSLLEAELPREGVLVPLVLRDQVAAALYADRLAGDELVIEALQALVYAAAQAIESLPFRERGTTPTLHLATAEAGAEAPALPVWQAAAEAAPAAVVEVGEEEEAAGGEAAAAPAEGPEAPAYEEAAAPAAVEPVYEEPALEEAPAGEPEPAEPPSAEEVAAAPAEEAPEPAAAPVWGERIEEEDTAASLDDTAAMLGSPLEDAAAAGWRLEEAEPAAAPEPIAPGWVAEEEAPVWGAPVEEAPAWGTPIEEPEEWGAPVEEAAPPPSAWPAETAAVPATPGAPIPGSPEWRSAPTAGWSVPADEAAAAAAAPAPLDDTARVPHLQPSETVMLRTDAWGAPAEAPAAEAPPPAGPAQTVRISTAGPEVAPPSGVQGPGWAFATTRLQVAPDDEAQHEEARRLARLLVSEIKLYNEEQVDEGRRNRDLYERLKEDIDRSRQMYEERVEQRILNTTDYFYQELVRILAAGDSKALGI